MRTAYFDCIGGASGDMILGALLDGGLPEETLRQELSKLGLDDFSLHISVVQKGNFGATKVDVVVQGDVPARHLADLERIVQRSTLSPSIVERTLAMLRRLAQVEADIHRTTVDRVHLHELGGVDTLVDIVGALAGLDALQVERVVVSPIPLGRGFIRGAHGNIPLPAPATVALLQGVPVIGREIEAELVTPTGALLLSTLADSFGPIPQMTLTSVGYGAGGRDLPVPNVLRLLLGDADSAASVADETLVQLDTNIDDLNPEHYQYVMDRLFSAGALDVFLSPLYMKKNRPGTRLSVLCRPGMADDLMAIVFAETSTLGIRWQEVRRRSLPRQIVAVETAYGTVHVKVAFREEKPFKWSPEYEDCRRLAEATGEPLRRIYEAAQQAAERLWAS